MDDVIIRIAGANGDGIESASRLLAKVIAKNGFFIFGFRSYQSVIRAGSVWFQIRASNRKVNSIGNHLDLLFCLNKQSISDNIDAVDKSTIIVYDSKDGEIDEETKATCKQAIALPILDGAIKTGGDSIYRNTVIIGIIAKALGLDKESTHASINEVFRKKLDVVNANIAAADFGYSLDSKISGYALEKSNEKPGRYLLDGNTAVALGAAAANCRFYAAYPMTPASSILEWFAAHENYGIMYKQTEDEIAAINMAIGASYAGVRSMCGTSGGGFSLMVEALGMAGMAEVPLVVVDSQRGGPSTGLPTKTEQGDLLFVSTASQGDFPRVVIAPTSIEECFYKAAEAFNIADTYQCPVILLLDLFLSEHIETVNIDKSRIVIKERKFGEYANERFKRYAITENGISPLSMPGMKGMEFVAATDEHDEYGDLMSDIYVGTPKGKEWRVAMHSKRMKKIDTMLNDNAIPMPEIINPNAKNMLVTFGSAAESCKEAIEMLSGKVDIGLIAFSYVLPLPKGISEVFEGKRLIDVECNYSGQLEKLIAMQTGIKIKDKIV
ncbi:MAG: 2-oxoacid:acceptor oxidoreductase subunit alpha, partial [Candidatus Micrarchaeaceae archaeon]